MATVPVQTQIIDRDELARFVPAKNFRLIKFFENLAKDVSSTLPAAIGQSVQGPGGGSVDDNVVVFNGTTGFLVKDSGVSIDDLAPLDSPAFTGTPTAPTPPAVDSSTRLATTAFVGGATADAVEGPATATDSAIALFDGATGKLIKDSAVLLTSLAPLASPALTGSPTAPTPAAGDSDTSVATTAFVQDEFAARVAAGSYFSAHNNGVAQSIPSGAFTQLNFSTEAYDVGSDFAANAWTPPAGRLVTMKGAVAIATVAAAANYTVAIFKNGAEYKRGTMYTSNQVGTQVVTVVCDDVPNGTDVYSLRVYQSTGAAQNTNGGANLTYFQGCSVQT